MLLLEDLLELFRTLFILFFSFSYLKKRGKKKTDLKGI